MQGPYNNFLEVPVAIHIYIYIYDAIWKFISGLIYIIVLFSVLYLDGRLIEIIRAMNVKIYINRLEVVWFTGLNTAQASGSADISMLNTYRQIHNIRRTLIKKIVDHSDAVFSIACRRCSNYIFILDLTPDSIYCAEATARQGESNSLRLVIGYLLY